MANKNPALTAANRTTARAAHLSAGCRNAYVQFIVDALNAWAMEPSVPHRKAVTRAMDRYLTQLTAGAFPAPDRQPFGTAGHRALYGLPADLPRLLQEAREILPALVEVEEQAKQRRIAEALERSRETRSASKTKPMGKAGKQGRMGAPYSLSEPLGEDARGMPLRRSVEGRGGAGRGAGRR